MFRRKRITTCSDSVAAKLFNVKRRKVSSMMQVLNDHDILPMIVVHLVTHDGVLLVMMKDLFSFHAFLSVVVESKQDRRQLLEGFIRRKKDSLGSVQQKNGPDVAGTVVVDVIGFLFSTPLFCSRPRYQCCDFYGSCMSYSKDLLFRQMGSIQIRQSPDEFSYVGFDLGQYEPLDRSFFLFSCPDDVSHLSPQRPRVVSCALTRSASDHDPPQVGPDEPRRTHHVLDDGLLL